MSGAVINIETLNITINIPSVQQTAEEKQAEFAESVRIERAAKEAEQEISAVLAGAGIVHIPDPSDNVFVLATFEEKKDFILKQFEAIAARSEARKLRQQSFR